MDHAVVEDLVGRLRAAGCVFAEEEAAVLLETTTDPVRLTQLVARRAGGEPLEYVVGWARFAGVRLVVHPGVFVPRPRTEALVRMAVRLLRGQPGPVVLDLCCGCGAIGAAIAAAVPGIRLWASDIDPAAVANARENLRSFDAVVRAGDLDAAVPSALRGTARLVTANVPYVPSQWVEFLPAQARDHEPRTALDGGVDGLDVLRRLVPRAAGWLAPGGFLLSECALDQVPAAADVLRRQGLQPVAHNDAELDVAVVAGRR